MQTEFKWKACSE